MTTDTLVDISGRDELQLGLALGALATVAVLLATWRRSDDEAEALPIAGLALAAAAATAIATTSTLPWLLAVGLVALAGGGHLARGSSSRAVLLAAPGALLVALAGPSEPAWVPVAVVVAVVVGGAGAADLDRRYATSGLGTILFAISVLGVYVAVPETRSALALATVAAPLVLVAWPWTLVRLGDAGAFASVGLLCWVAADGGIERPSAVIGGLACLGMLVVEPATRLLRRVRTSGRSPDALVIGGLHLVTVAVVARVAGVDASTVTAIGVASATLAGAFAAILATRGRRPNPSG